MILQRKASQTFDSSQFLPDHQPPRTCDITRKAGYILNGDQEVKAVIDIVQQIVFEWCIGSSKLERWRLWLLRGLHEAFGNEILTTSITWDIFRTATKKEVYRPSSPVGPDFSMFIAASKDHCLSHPSLERETLHAIAACLLDLADLSKPEPPTMAAILIETPVMVDRLSSDFKTRRADSLRRFVREGLAVLFRDVSKESASLLQASMMAEPERCFPFREFTPERLRFKTEHGPYAPAIVTTPSGIFSALLWRALTSNTPFAEREKMVFNDHVDWLTNLQQLPATCNLVYIVNSFTNTTNPAQMAAKARVYWKSVEKLNWPAFLDRKPSFLETYRLFHQAKNSGQAQPFPFLGSTGAFQLVCNLSYTSIIPEPTLEDIGECMADIGRGSWEAIQILNDKSEDDLKNARPTKEQCVMGLQGALDIVQHVMTDTEMQESCMDYRSLEHLLGRFTHVWKKKLLL